jgi:hypothetical protein
LHEAHRAARNTLEGSLTLGATAPSLVVEDEGYIVVDELEVH